MICDQRDKCPRILKVPGLNNDRNANRSYGLGDGAKCGSHG